MRTRTLAAGLGAAILSLSPLAAMAETQVPEDQAPAAYGSEGQLAGWLTEQGYTDVVCEKTTPVDAETYTLQTQDAIALRIHGNVAGKELWLDPLMDKAYAAPAEAENAKINFVIVCTGTAPAQDDEGTATEEPGDDTAATEEPGDDTAATEEPGGPDDEETADQTGPVVETDGPSERPGNAGMILGGGAVVAGAAALLAGRRLLQD